MPLAGRECCMSELWIKIRRRKDRKGKWLVDVKRGAERSVRTFSTYEEADEAAKAVRRAQRRGELRVEKPKPRTLADLCTRDAPSTTGSVQFWVVIRDGRG